MAIKHGDNLVELEEPDFQTDDMEVMRVAGIDYYNLGSGGLAQCAALALQSEYGFKCIQSGGDWLVHHPTDMDRLRITVLVEVE